ncbi:MAG: hypothetical protein MJK04_22030 [Psychrosphaera sp.]|nr:hypothetical protein [Psychrosphaera sp.]
MQAPKLALILSIILFVIGVTDLFTRVIVSVDVTNESSEAAQQVDDEANAKAMLLSFEEVEKLLNWSDIKPKVVVAAVAKVAKAKPSVAVKPKVDVHAVVKANIAGDASKFLVGDELLSLRGLFYDGQEFAVVEIENIVTKKIKYYRAKVNESLASHQLAKIGKNHVMIKSGQQTMKLQLFDHF